MNLIDFEFSDTIAGYVISYNSTDDSFTICTSDNREYKVKLCDTTYARLLRNLDEDYRDCTQEIRKMLINGRYLFVYGVHYPNSGTNDFEAKCIDFPSAKVSAPADNYRFEEADWWIKQAKSISDFFIRHQFGENREIDYSKYRTTLALSGEQMHTYTQETDTISRLVYGFSSTYLLTGDEKYLEAAEKGWEYLKQHMRFYDLDEEIVYWFHGISVRGETEHKLFTSEFGDDYDAIPMYEQIYALAGPVQLMRINNSADIRSNCDLTIKLFNNFFRDKERGGYFSHIDPITLDASSESLGQNKGRKNWNSIGDHAPAYLINLWLATGDPQYLNMLEETADCISKHFPDFENSPFVQEKFHADWTADRTWGWQQDRAVVGHNMKIAWNLTRINNIIPKNIYLELAEKLALKMSLTGMDKQRGGWYDMMERTKAPGENYHRFTWHDRKAWWQQEQAILANQILYGVQKDPLYLQLARESAAFYNTFFLDHDDGGIYFNVLANGMPYLLGTERLKGSHAMSGYHSIELAYLATIYTNLLHTNTPLTLYYKPLGKSQRNSDILRVAPDILPKNRVHISAVTMDGKTWDKYDTEELTVTLPETEERVKIAVTLVSENSLNQQ